MRFWAQNAGRPERVISVAESSSRRIRILVVDDDILVLRNTTLMLEDMGHEIIEAIRVWKR